MAQWFRFYNETLDDPKVQKLPAETFRGWVNLLCLAARNDGALPPYNDIAFALRLPDAKATALLDALVAAELLDHDDAGLRPHNWNGRQYKSDVTDPTNAERQKRWRNGKSNGDNAAPTVTAKRPDTETESEQIKPNPNGLGKKPTKGTRLANDWQPDREDRRFCEKDFGWGFDRQCEEAPRFRDYWIAQPGAKGVKLDWAATWRNWCRRAHDDEQRRIARTPNRAGRATADERRHAIFASVSGELGNRGDATGGGGEFGNGFDGGERGPDADTAENLRGADGSVVRVVAYASQGIVGDVERTACEVSPGRSETRLGSRPENPQMGISTEDRADGGSGGIGPMVSAQAESQIHVGQGHHASGMGQAGSDAEFFDLGSFKRF